VRWHAVRRKRAWMSKGNESTLLDLIKVVRTFLMRELIRNIGIGLIAVGCGIIAFWLYFTLRSPMQQLDPIPGRMDLEVIYITPTRR
jgi:hypothetical protein